MIVQLLFIILVAQVCCCWGLAVKLIAQTQLATPWRILLLVIGVVAAAAAGSFRTHFVFGDSCGHHCGRLTVYRTATNGKKKPSKFSLATLLWMTVLIAALLAVIVRTRIEAITVWFSLIAGGIASGGATLIGAWAGGEGLEMATVAFRVRDVVGSVAACLCLRYAATPIS